MAAAILKVNQLNTWIGRPFSKGYFTKGIESLKKCATRFLFINNDIEKQIQQNEQNSNQPVQNNEQPNSPALISPNTGFEEFVNLFFYGDNQTQTVLNFEIKQEQINKEIENFRILLSNNYAVLNEIKSTKDFWIKNVNALPDLKRLALILI